MLSAARTQIADLQRQLAEARADLRERETEIALMAARTGVHLRKIERLEQQLADAEADAQMMLELKRRSGERAQKVEALLYRGCNDCIYEPRNRNSDQCDGCDVWYGLLRAGIETERHGRTELNGRGQMSAIPKCPHCSVAMQPVGCSGGHTRPWRTCYTTYWRCPQCGNQKEISEEWDCEPELPARLEIAYSRRPKEAQPLPRINAGLEAPPEGWEEER